VVTTSSPLLPNTLRILALVEGDGVDDLIVGAYGANLSDKIDAGKSYVIFGKQDNTASVDITCIGD
jgi:hypothetical protein